MGIDRHDLAALALVLIERRQANGVDGIQQRAEAFALQIKLAGRQRLVRSRLCGAALAAGAGRLARLIIIQNEL